MSREVHQSARFWRYIRYNQWLRSGYIMSTSTKSTSGRKTTQKVYKSQASKSKGKAVATAADPPPPPPPPPANPHADPSSLGITFALDEHRQRYEKLMRRGVAPTRYGDPRILEIMGIRGNVEELLNAAGLSQCVAPRPTYLRYVLEFFSTLELQTDPSKCKPTVSALTFRLQNEERTLSSRVIGQIYGFRRFNIQDLTIAPAFHLPQFWEQITSATGIIPPIPYDSRACKLTSIRSPVVKYLQKLLSLTLCARKEASSPRNREMEMLCAIVDKRPRDFQEDLVSCFKKVLQELTVDRKKEAKSPDPIYCGGLITPIIAHFGISLESHTPISESYLLSWDEMESMRMVIQGYKSGTSGFSAAYVMQNVGNFLRLPNPALTHIRNLRDVQNLELSSPAHLAESVDPLCEEIMSFGRVRKPKPVATGGAGGGNEEGSSQATPVRRKRPAPSMPSQEERLSGIEDRLEQLGIQMTRIERSQDRLLELFTANRDHFMPPSQPPPGPL